MNDKEPRPTEQPDKREKHPAPDRCEPTPTDNDSDGGGSPECPEGYPESQPTGRPGQAEPPRQK